MFASIRHSLPYVRFKSAKKAIQRALKLPRYLGSEYRCPICGVGLRAFKPIWRSYTRKVEQFGYVHRHAELETFNREAFSCPKCDASDRDRLMAIFLDGILPSADEERQRPVRRFRTVRSSEPEDFSAPLRSNTAPRICIATMCRTGST